MEASELRIGNYIWNSHGYIQKISAQDIYDLSGYENGEPERCQYFQPVPITEEWLARFGFEEIEERLYCKRWHLDRVDIYKMISGNYPFYFRFNQTDIKAKHVHQLQNLYNSLTGEELTI